MSTTDTWFNTALHAFLRISQILEADLPSISCLFFDLTSVFRIPTKSDSRSSSVCMATA